MLSETNTTHVFDDYLVWDIANFVDERKMNKLMVVDVEPGSPYLKLQTFWHVDVTLSPGFDASMCNRLNSCPSSFQDLLLESRQLDVCIVLAVALFWVSWITIVLR